MIFQVHIMGFLVLSMIFCACDAQEVETIKCPFIALPYPIILHIISYCYVNDLKAAVNEPPRYMVSNSLLYRLRYDQRSDSYKLGTPLWQQPSADGECCCINTCVKQRNVFLLRGFYDVAHALGPKQRIFIIYQKDGNIVTEIINNIPYNQQGHINTMALSYDKKLLVLNESIGHQRKLVCYVKKNNGYNRSDGAISLADDSTYDAMRYCDALQSIALIKIHSINDQEVIFRQLQDTENISMQNRINGYFYSKGICKQLLQQPKNE